MQPVVSFVRHGFRLLGYALIVNGVIRLPAIWRLAPGVTRLTVIMYVSALLGPGAAMVYAAKALERSRFVRLSPEEYQPRRGDCVLPWLQPVATVVGVILWLLLVNEAFLWAENRGLPEEGMIYRCLWLYLPCRWLAALCHELGHAIAGRIGGMKLVGFAVRPFVAEKQLGSWKLRTNNT